MDASGSLDPAGWGIFRANFSPDGEEVAFWATEYKHGTFLIGVGQNGKPRAVTPDDVQASDYAWMPDSRSLLVSYRAGNRDQLAIYGIDGRLIRKIDVATAFRNEFDDGMSVRPDGKVAVIAAVPPGEGVKPADLLEVDLETGQAVALTHTAGPSYFFPSYADPTHVVFVVGTANSPEAPGPRLRVLDRQTGDSRDLSPITQAVVSASAPYGLNQAVYEVFGGYGQSTLWLVGIDGGAPHQLQGTGYRWPSIDATGRWLLVGKVGTPSSPGGLKIIPVTRTS